MFTIANRSRTDNLPKSAFFDVFAPWQLIDTEIRDVNVG
jgi:hypothetical protein